MRKYIKVGALLFLVFVVSFLGYKINANLKHKKEVALRIKSVPRFTFKTLENKDFTQVNINQELPKLFVYFNSECDFCNSEAQKIHDNLESLKNIQILFVSHEEINGIINFSKKHQLENKANIIFLADTKLEFSEIFDAKTLPFMLLYSKENRLIKKFKGATKIDKIIEVLISSQRKISPK